MLRMFMLSFAIAIATSACHKKEDQKPVAPPEATSTPSPSPVATATPAVCPQAAPGMYTCYNWGDCNGLFATKDQAVAILAEKDSGGCNKVDDEVVKNGFAPCSECKSISSAKSMLAMKVMSFEDVLKLRDGKTKVEKK